jgi:hypothetical protein
MESASLSAAAGADLYYALHSGLGRRLKMSDSALATTPTDDVGAATLDRFRYQAHLIARACAALVLDPRVSAVICEWHEDYVVQFANGPSEIVSVKHHDGSQNNWTVRQLCVDGGLRHLFERFQLLEEGVTCRLQTNEQLRTGSQQPAALRDCCADRDGDGIAAWATRLTSYLGATDGDLVARFLRRLTIEDGMPDRNVVHPVHVQQLMPPLLGRLGLGGDASEPSYEALVALAFEACAAPGREIVIGALADPAQLGSDAQRSRLLAAKTIDRARVLDAIGRRPGVPSVLLSAPTDLTPSRTRLVKKLEAGGVGATGVRSARRLRANWEMHRNAWSTGLPGDEDVVEDLKARVVREASVAEARTRRAGEHYASEMLIELSPRLQPDSIGGAWPGPLTADLLLGLAFERTEACEIFWSDEFDPDGVT